MPWYKFKSGVWVPFGGSTATITPPTTPLFTVDVTRPAASNVGAAAWGYTPTVSIDQALLTLTTGQVVENRIINANVVMGSGSTLRGCIVNSRAFGTYANAGAIILIPAGLASPPTIEMTNIRPTAAMHYGMNCIVANGPFFMRYTDASGGTDLIKANGTLTGMEMFANYMHGFSYRNDDADQAGSTPPSVSHNDGVQFHNGATGWYSHGNFWEMIADPTLSVGTAASSSATGWGCPITIDTNAVSNLKFTKEWFSGGGSAGIFQANQSPAGQVLNTAIELSYSRCALNQYDFGSGSRYQIRYSAAGYGSLIGETTNYFDPTLPGVTAAGIDNKLFAVGTSGTSGIRRG